MNTILNYYQICIIIYYAINREERPYVLHPVTRTLPPVNGSRRTGRAIRTVDLGDVTEMSHEAKRDLREMVDDSRKLFLNLCFPHLVSP